MNNFKVNQEKQEQELAAYALSLKDIKGVGDQSVIKLLKDIPTHEEFQKSDYSIFQESVGSKIASNLLDDQAHIVSKLMPQKIEIIKEYEEKDIFTIALSDKRYPIKLKNIKDPPSVLYARGNISALHAKRSIAIVGTRNPTDNGLRQAIDLSEAVSKQKIVVVSGLAKGIDTEAHKGSVLANAEGVAVFGTDLLTVYPKENEDLFNYLLNCEGVAVSEIPLGEENTRGAFVRRDRIQAGLSDVIVPVQSDIGGGTMHTVKFAGKYDRPVLVPRPDSTDRMAPNIRGTE